MKSKTHAHESKPRERDNRKDSNEPKHDTPRHTRLANRVRRKARYLLEEFVDAKRRSAEVAEALGDNPNADVPAAASVKSRGQGRSVIIEES